jgi:hypothetical protein
MVLILVVAAVTVALAACEKREDFPPLLPIDSPPTPYDFEVVQGLPPDTLDYDLTWKIDDPDSLVKEYWIYAYSSVTIPDTVGTTTDMFYAVRTAVDLPGLVFGVSAVTGQNVESDIVTAPAP